MINYQMFVNYFGEIKKTFDSTGLDDLDTHMVGKLRLKHYKMIGIDTEDKIKQYEHKKSKEMFDNIDMALKMSHIFEIDTIIKRYLVLNKPPQTKEFYKSVTLPFKTIFLDIEIDESDYEIGVDKIYGIMITETPVIVNKEDPKEIKFEKIGMGYRVHYLCHDGDKIFIDEFKIIIDNTNVPIFYDDKVTLRFLKEFIMNLLVFINDKEIQIVERKRSGKSVQRRVREGKMILPDSKFIRLTGTLKKYIDSVSIGLGSRKFGYKFWVRGHMRYLASDRYTNKRGQWIKIEPFIKGEGVLVERIYRITSDKEDDRIIQLKKDNIFYDDIEPLKIPLHKIMEKKSETNRG